ncbi:hypothetical protein GOBAR_AA17870 [Gossypium barbadense]|uniref:Uncharacterized protein n=1 Tax=Gossypium barbadense TaxID=3634 RepID=A0A2P5XHM6_GOSBA|nr:hypothetical protein GOBAR_AA17870 [Gossypium barbadense]
MGDETITLQARNSGITSNIEGNGPHQSIETDNMTQPTLQKLSFKEVHEPCSSNDRGHIHEERRLRIEELDKWRAHKPKTHDKPKLRQKEFDTSPNQLNVGDKVLLDAADPHTVTTTPNEEIPLTVLSIFPFGVSTETRPSTRACLRPCENRAKEFPNTGCNKMPRPSNMAVVEPAKTTRVCDTTMWKRVLSMSSSRRKKTTVPASKKRKGASSSAGPTAKICHPLLQFPRGPQEELFQILRARPLVAGRCIDWAAIEQVQMADVIWALLTIDPWELFFGIIEPTYLELTMELCLILIHQLSVPEFGAPLGLYTKEFKEENKLHALSRHIHFSPSKCWHTLAPSTTSYNPSRSKASILPLSLRYLYALLAHTITRRRESTGVVNTHDVYFLWCMSQGHVIDLAYFIALAIQHQRERHQKGVISFCPYVTRLARHFGLFITAAQESSLTLIGQMSLQGISSMLRMRMIEGH